jgi:class 3 adenylate cyclase
MIAKERSLSETPTIAANLCSDVISYGWLAGTNDDRILAPLQAPRSDLIDPMVAVRNGRIVKPIGDGSLTVFRSEVNAVRCAIRDGLLSGSAICSDETGLRGVGRLQSYKPNYLYKSGESATAAAILTCASLISFGRT